MNALFTSNGWDDYQFWAENDRSVMKRINNLVESMSPDPRLGAGSPERLQGALDGCWSRRITGQHRLVYLVERDDFVILQARYRYG